MERWGQWVAHHGRYIPFEEWTRFALGGEDLKAVLAYCLEDQQEKPLADILDKALETADLDAPEPVRFYGKHLGFQGFSNFYFAPIKIGTITYSTTEHYYQAMKARTIYDHEDVRKAETPGKAKRLGQRVALREDWEDIKEWVMRAALAMKFQQHPKLQVMLLNTGNLEIIEASPTDYYWGEGRKGTGQNRLGVLLVEVREALREGTIQEYETAALKQLP